MLAPFVIHLLIGCLILLLVGWVSTALPAVGASRGADGDFPATFRPAQSSCYDDPDASWTARIFGP
jgi:hypothetical protein